jgi:NAD(P)-dependent dehydrogenase (short-subunit alcohol dehydrogenase family)
MKNWVFRQRTETDAMSEYYENKVAVVTGAASGIGLALSELLLSFGAKAVVLADLNAEKLEKERERLDALHPGKVLGCQTDVTKQQSVAAMIRSAAEFGAGQIHFLLRSVVR